MLYVTVILINHTYRYSYHHIQDQSLNHSNTHRLSKPLTQSLIPPSHSRVLSYFPKLTAVICSYIPPALIPHPWIKALWSVFKKSHFLMLSPRFSDSYRWNFSMKSKCTIMKPETIKDHYHGRIPYSSANVFSLKSTSSGVQNLGISLNDAHVHVQQFHGKILTFPCTMLSEAQPEKIEMAVLYLASKYFKILQIF